MKLTAADIDDQRNPLSVRFAACRQEILDNLGYGPGKLSARKAYNLQIEFGMKLGGKFKTKIGKPQVFVFPDGTIGRVDPIEKVLNAPVTAMQEALMIARGKVETHAV